MSARVHWRSYRAARERLGDDTRIVWLATTDAELAAARGLGLDAERKSGWRGFWLTARARVLVVTHGFGDVNRYATRGALRRPAVARHPAEEAAPRLPRRAARVVPAESPLSCDRSSPVRIGSPAVASRSSPSRQSWSPRASRARSASRRDRIVVTGDPRDDALLSARGPCEIGGAAPHPLRADLAGRAARPRRARCADLGCHRGLARGARRRAARAHPSARQGRLRGRTGRSGSRPDARLGRESSTSLRGSAAFDALITDYSSIAFDYALVGRSDRLSRAGRRELREDARHVRPVPRVQRRTTRHDVGARARGARRTASTRRSRASTSAGCATSTSTTSTARAAERVLDEILARTGEAGAGAAPETPIARPRIDRHRARRRRRHPESHRRDRREVTRVSARRGARPRRRRGRAR